MEVFILIGHSRVVTLSYFLRIISLLALNALTRWISGTKETYLFKNIIWSNVRWHVDHGKIIIFGNWLLHYYCDQTFYLQIYNGKSKIRHQHQYESSQLHVTVTPFPIFAFRFRWMRVRLSSDVSNEKVTPESLWVDFFTMRRKTWMSLVLLSNKGILFQERFWFDLRISLFVIL